MSGCVRTPQLLETGCHLPPNCESSSSGSDWASSGDEWRPSPSPSSSSSSANSQSAWTLPSSPASDPNAPTDLPVPAKTFHTGTLMEDKPAGMQPIKREMKEPDGKETVRDPEDNRYLCFMHSQGIQPIEREMEEPDRKETSRDPEDDRYLCE
ncbi:hypothetical protein AAHC03_02055 [Spirometra sp. Aus1]